MELIVAEKPKVANKIAYALSNNIKQRRFRNVRYYLLEDIDAVVVPAVGHLYTVAAKKNSYGYPIFDVEWKPIYEVNKSAYYTKQYLQTLKYWAERTDSITIACDYDVEGSLIGYNIYRFIYGEGEAKRMKFSTLTKYELRESYENSFEIDLLNGYAGEARHIIDWYYGINLSRALMGSLRKVGIKQIMSIGRVQGPTLAFVVDRENEIENFESKPFWNVYIYLKKKKFVYKETLWEKEKAEKIKEAIEEKAIIKDIEETEKNIHNIYPFDLTTLQIEAYRYLKIPPAKTLAIAQSLYENSYISYPRTSSQKLPANLGIKYIVEKISKIKDYSPYAKKILEKPIRVRQGKKDDEAHPAIHPTGQIGKMTKEEQQLYDLIVRRFLATMYPPMKIKHKKIIAISGNEFIGEGNTIAEKGWYEVYNFQKIKEEKIDGFEKGKSYKVEKKGIKQGKTKPPARYNQASLIKELEKRNLGTKATRAVIVNTLFKRKYLIGKIIKPTDFGRAVYSALKEYAPEVLDEKLTRRLEEDIVAIQKGKKQKEEVIEESKEILKEVLLEFKKNEEKIGKSIMKNLS